jgi:hypothetical protein
MNSRISLFNISVNLTHVIMMFIFEYARTLQVLSSPVQHNADVAVTVHAHYQLCGGTHVTRLAPLSQWVRWHPFSRKLCQCHAILSLSQLWMFNVIFMYGAESSTDRSITWWLTHLKKREVFRKRIQQNNQEHQKRSRNTSDSHM